MPMSSFVFVRAALVDADGRVLLVDQKNKQPEQIWDFPGGQNISADLFGDLMRHLQSDLKVTTVTKAFFPLTFSLVEQKKAPEVTLLHGCRNWVGPNGLQHVMAEDGSTLWVKPTRMGDYALTESCRMMMASLITLLS